MPEIETPLLEGAPGSWRNMIRFASKIVSWNEEIPWVRVKEGSSKEKTACCHADPTARTAEEFETHWVVVPMSKITSRISSALCPRLRKSTAIEVTPAAI